MITLIMVGDVLTLPDMDVRGGVSRHAPFRVSRSRFGGHGRSIQV
jgi:hypothetical protein